MPVNTSRPCKRGEITKQKGKPLLQVSLRGTLPSLFLAILSCLSLLPPSSVGSGDSVLGSVGPEDSFSQIPSFKTLSWDKSVLNFKEFASFLGIQGDNESASFPELLSALGAKEIEGRLPNAICCLLALGSRCGTVRHQPLSRSQGKAECAVTPS